MEAKKPLIALISATPLAIPPAREAVIEEFGDVEVWNILDDRLMVEAETRGGLTPALAARMESLISFAVDQGADAALLTCSLYGSVAEQYTGSIPILAPDQAVFEDVAKSPHERILVVASFDEAMVDSKQRLIDVAAAGHATVQVSGIAVREAMASAKLDDPAVLIDDLTNAIQPLVTNLDAVLLAQYSLAPASAELEKRLGIPVFTGPASAARRLRSETGREAPRGIFGVIADDYTGAIDVADSLRTAGLRTLLMFGLDDQPDELPEHDAIVVALKTRSIPADEAIENSLAAAEYLQQRRADQVYFKYCSTFDSTPQGNIGPVLAALATQLEAQTVVTTPSSPMHARTVYSGHLYVGDVLLEDSHMAQHPLNPMTDSLLPRLLSAQLAGQVHTLPLGTIRQGHGAIQSELEQWAGTTPTFVVADGVTQEDLNNVAATQVDAPLTAGAAGFALALARVRASRAQPQVAGANSAEHPQNEAAVLAGSCSASTLEQIAQFQAQGNPSYQLLASEGMTAAALTADALQWYDSLPTGSTPLIYSSVTPEALAQIRRELDGDKVAETFEQALAGIARGLKDRGIDRFVVAGGETSGSVTRGLGVTSGVMGSRVDDGVAWLYSTQQPSLALLLKSGNFGDADMFLRATSPEQNWGERSE